MPRANRPPKPSVSYSLRGVAAEPLPDLKPLAVEVAAELLLIFVPELPVLPEMPWATAVPGRLTVAFAARA